MEIDSIVVVYLLPFVFDREGKFLAETIDERAGSPSLSTCAFIQSSFFFFPFFFFFVPFLCEVDDFELLGNYWSRMVRTFPRKVARELKAGEVYVFISFCFLAF